MQADLEENLVDYLDEHLGMLVEPEPTRPPVDRATWGRTPDAVASQQRAELLLKGDPQ